MSCSSPILSLEYLENHSSPTMEAPCNTTTANNNGESNHNHVSKKPKLSPSFISDLEIRQEFSHHLSGVARINNGSFGCCPASVISAQKDWQLKFLQQPDDFYANHLRAGLADARAAVKRLINADDIAEVSIVDNATTAAAIVLQQIHWGFAEGRFRGGDTVVMLHCAFQSVKKAIQAYVSRAGGSVIEVQLPFPVSSDGEIVAEFRRGLERGRSNGRRVRLAIIDHITSMPCVVTPVRDLVRVCREEGVDQVFVDAAHAIGSVRVDVNEIGADFYVSNLYKWFFCPPSVAFLHCKKSHWSSQMHHPVVSHEYGNGLAIESSWIGTRDYSPQLVVPSAFEFVNRFEGGIDGIMERNHKAVVEMGEMLAKSWGTILGSPPHMCASMVMIGLPSKLQVSSEGVALKLRSHLRAHYRIEVPIYYQPWNEGGAGRRDKDGGHITAYARISHQVYNTADDYDRLNKAIIQLVEDCCTCKMLPYDD